jgi:DNA-binding transcriptional LysR family regulator
MSKSVLVVPQLDPSSIMRPRQELLVARRAGQIVLGLHAHQDYLSRRGTPKSIADLDNHALIGFDETTAFIRGAGKSFSAWRREAFSLRTDNNLAQLALIRSGAGIGVCQAAIAQRDNRIVRILPKQFSLPLEAWITMHQDLRNSPRCRVTFDALVKGLQQHIDSIVVEIRFGSLPAPRGFEEAAGRFPEE